ncbi:T9SS type A sorting domain-containing protein [Cesiribacter andamanensis]|uniref:Secretion system C-terminal sorting domain-containing protein n=1 Tax=Cesiribacter andamanensis AMV16 TaxID=1279009 RepID=M7N0D1_9BACT|nr:T9SS type A sorting domain-containing protein [Cesiribacter andamanensis]EMR02153.1 hypothetical protein ADICEAN_02715 [Cesiribacter andamanensis AMV16]
MKNSLLLWIVTLALGVCVQEAAAQQAPAKKSYKIIIQEKGEEAQVFEYNSLEELRADPRLKDKRLPGFEEGDGRFFLDRDAQDHPFVLRADKLMMLRDSLSTTPFRRYLSIPEGAEIQGSRHFFRSDSGAVIRGDVFKRLEELDIHMPDVEKIQVYRLSEDSLVGGQLSEELRSLLKERQGALGEQERVLIFRLREGAERPALPEAPSLPAPPALPDAELRRLPEPERKGEWLEELSVYPNPSSTQLNVRLQSATPGPALLRLIDSSGRVVHEEQLPDAGLLIKKVLPVPQGKKGVYLLQLKQGNSTHTHRVLLQ